MKHKIVKKILIVLLALFVIGGVFFVKQIVLPQRVSSDNSVTDLSPASSQTLEIKASGEVESDNQSTLGFLSAGRVAAVNVKEGDHVQQGEVLANLDTAQASQAVAAAQANYNSAQAAVNKVIDDIHLFQYGNGGQANVGTANETAEQKAQRQEAEAARDAAYENLQSAQKNLSLQTIVAPFDGVVTSVTNVAIGQNVDPTSQSSITVSGQGDLKFVAQVSEADVNSIHPGDQVTVNIDALKGKSLQGNVTKVADTRTTLTSGQNIFKVDVDVPILNSNAKIGQGGTALIESAQGTTAITVPTWLVLSGHYVWVVDGDTPKLKEVKVGNVIDGKTQILSGLNPSDKIILNPMYLVNKKYKVI